MIRVGRLVWLWVLLALSSACSRSCSGCHSPGSLATVIELRGSGLEIDHAPPGDKWEPAAAGDELQSGDELRTDDHSSATLRLRDGSELTLSPSSVLRFLPAGSPDEQNLDLVMGDAVVRSGPEELHLRTHVGLATLRTGGTVRLTRSGNALSLHVQVGEATFRGSDGKEVTISRGEHVRLEIGAAVIRTTDGAASGPASPRGLRLLVSSAGVQTRSSGQAAWSALAAGEQSVAPKTEVSLAAGAQSTLRHDDDEVQLFGVGEYRLHDGASLVTTSRGSLRTTARSHDIQISVPGGFIIARAVPGGSAYAVRVTPNEGVLEVKGGDVTWQTTKGRTAVAAGTAFRWNLDGQDPPVDTAAESGDTPAPERPSFAVKAGESFVVHAPELPVAIGFSLGELCRGDAVVELKGGERFRGGTGSTAAWLTDAVRSYQVRCPTAARPNGQVVARGNARALRDSGTRELPPVAPTSLVDTDGHNYTIYYQNQLPDIRVRWPNAPQAKRYQLDLDGKLMTLDKPEHTLTSGSLSDGQHRLTFAAEERRSRTANVEVRFDNTTTTASLSGPADRGWKPGDTVDIDGVALPAWKVSVDGGTIQKLGDDRFHGQVVTTDSQPDFAVRLSHPRLGTHYYVRRARE
ncbi:MAG: FecR domain-containing protein [Polyangiales bacterium]